MATREAWSNVSRLVSFVAVGVILELATDHAKLHPGQPASVAQQPLLFHTICGLFIVGGIFGATVLMFYRVREILPPVHSSPPGGAAATIPTPIEGQAAGPYTLLRALRSSLVEPWSDRLFRRFTTFYTALNVSTAMCTIYVWRIALNHVGFSELWTNIALMLVGAMASLLTMKWVGRGIDRFGRRPVLVVSTVMATLWILCFVFLEKTSLDAECVRAINRLAGCVGTWLGHGDFAPSSRRTPWWHTGFAASWPRWAESRGPA